MDRPVAFAPVTESLEPAHDEVSALVGEGCDDPRRERHACKAAGTRPRRRSAWRTILATVGRVVDSPSVTAARRARLLVAEESWRDNKHGD